ncbi:peptidase S8/S53 domain-containing protein, partial [Phlyctochytrium arcticum]
YPTVSNNSVTGKPDVVVDVYVIGSGIAADHNEFIGRNVVPMLNLVGDGIEGDCSGHETHVASTIFGATAGIVRSSVAANVNLYDMRVLGCDGTGTMSNTMIAIQAATDQHKARVAADSQDPTLPRRRTVVNLSLVGPRMEAINQLVESATAQGIAFVCAAGNEGVEACSTKSPASAPAAITVAASGWADLGDYQPAWSNYGTCIDFFAPGVDIYGAGYSRTSNSSYVSKSGTSMASPFVTGVIVSWLAAGWAGADDASSVAELVRLMTKASLKNQITNGQVFTPNRLV